MQGIGGGSGEEWSGKSGDKSHAVQTLRVDRAASNIATAFGLRVLEHRFAPRGSDASLSISRHSHFGVRAKISFQEMVKIMTEHDLDLAERELHASQFHKS